MKNRLGLVAAWFLATALAVGVASQAVGLVADRAVGIPVQVPVAVGGQSAVGPLTSTPTDPPTPTTTTTTPTPTSTPTATTPATGATTTTVVTTTTIPPTTTTTSPPPLDSRTFFPPGGQVSVACTGPETIKYLGAVPQSGWTVELESAGPEKVKVEFHSAQDESEIAIRCHNGQLEEEISD